MKKIGAKADYDEELAENFYLGYQRRFEQLGIDIINNDIKIRELEVQIIDLSRDRSDELITKEILLREDIQRLESGVEDWKQRWLVEAPINGEVAFSKAWSLGQFVAEGQEILTIVPTEGEGKTLGRAVLSHARLGKVKKDMVVNIRLEEYPAQEFGILKGKVSHIARVPDRDNSIQLESSLDKPLVTTYKIELEFAQEMNGTASVITEDRRIIERIFDKVLSLLKNR